MTRAELQQQIDQRQEDLQHALKDLRKRIDSMASDAKENCLPRYTLASFSVRVDELTTEIKVLNQILLATTA